MDFSFSIFYFFYFALFNGFRDGSNREQEMIMVGKLSRREDWFVDWFFFFKLNKDAIYFSRKGERSV